MIEEFEGNHAVTTIIVAYSPTNTSAPEEVESFYDDLGDLIRDVPAHNFLTVLGNFNARLGPEDARFTLHSETNKNGKLLGNLMTEHGLLAANTHFRKREGKLWTHEDRCTNARRQMDYILVRKKWRNSVLNSEAYSSFNTTKSDHRMVSIKVRLSLRVTKTSPRTKYNWKEFSENRHLQEQYT